MMEIKRASLNEAGLVAKLAIQIFKVAEFRDFKKDSSTQSFTMSPSRWIKATNAKGIISKRGKYGGGTFAHPDIALEFASWLDPAFKLYLIKEFERLKYSEGYQQKVEWSVRRNLTKTNYKIHTDSIKEYIVPRLTDKQKTFVYATEADIINVALFGMTAKEWRECNPEENGNGTYYFTDCGHWMYSIRGKMAYQGCLCHGCLYNGKQTTLYIRGSKEANEYLSKVGIPKFKKYFI